jgi:hypothetical protein
LPERRGVGDDKFDLATGQREVLVLQKARDPFLEMNASGRKPAGFHGHQSDLDRLLLRHGRPRQTRDTGSGGSCCQKFSPA